MYDNTENRDKAIRESAAMLIKFDSYKDHAAKGRVQTLYYKHPFEFGSLDQLLMILDEVLDLAGFEKEPEDSRHLYENEEGENRIFLRFDEKRFIEDGKSSDNGRDISHINGDMYEEAAGSFQGDLTVRVLYRQHSSMQGEICTDERAVYFRSSLELLRLLYEFLEHYFHSQGVSQQHQIHISEDECVKEQT